jgi:1,4-dihydroxy-2-naphthoyl-CoA hydrolase
MLWPMAQTDFETYDEELARAIADSHEKVGGLPQYLGIRVTAYGPGRLVAVVPVRPDLLTPFGTLHGGVLAAFVDHMVGTVCYPVMQRRQWAATTEFKINYLAPVTKGELEATASILSLTKRTAVVRVEVMCEGRLACLAQGTVLIMDPKPKPEPGSV